MGTFFAFVFAIFLFLITSAAKTHHDNKRIRKHLKREFQYDISLLSEWTDEIEKILRKITGGDRQVFSYLRYTFFQRFFMQEAFRSGIMYKSLNNEQISCLNSVLLHCDIGMEQFMNGAIQQWKSGQLTPQDALRQFEFEKEELEKYQKHLVQISGDLDG